MRIKGSGSNYYQVNLEDRTCSCKDWTCRRHNFPYDSPMRLCKHLKEAMELSKNSNGFMASNPSTNESQLLNQLNSNKYILRYTMSNGYLLLRVLEDGSKYSNVDSIMKSLGFKRTSENTYSNGYKSLIVIRCNCDNYLFNRMYYSMSRDKYIELSSEILHRWNYKLTKEGLIDKEGKLMDFDLRTEEELSEVLEVRL